MLRETYKKRTQKYRTATKPTKAKNQQQKEHEEPTKPTKTKLEQKHRTRATKNETLINS